jgi:hypothetical protein
MYACSELSIYPSIFLSIDLMHACTLYVRLLCVSNTCVHAVLLMRFLLSYADVLQQGWVVDPDSRMLIVKKQSVKTEQKLDSSKLQRLTEYVFHLEH